MHATLSGKQGMFIPKETLKNVLPLRHNHLETYKRLENKDGNHFSHLQAIHENLLELNRPKE